MMMMIKDQDDNNDDYYDDINDDNHDNNDENWQNPQVLPTGLFEDDKMEYGFTKLL